MKFEQIVGPLEIPFFKIHKKFPTPPIMKSNSQQTEI